MNNVLGKWQVELQDLWSTLCRIYICHLTVIIKNTMTIYYEPVTLLIDTASSHFMHSTTPWGNYIILQMRKLRCPEVKQLSKSTQTERSRARIKNQYLHFGQSSQSWPAVNLGFSKPETNPSPLPPGKCSPDSNQRAPSPRSRASKPPELYIFLLPFPFLRKLLTPDWIRRED